jgi:exopolyphosphatase/guanosine-5'-triphosphate,3'-diphosphate pyrophosphatase
MSAKQSRRLAAIDLGTVTARLLIADAYDGVLSELLRQASITHLGDGLAQTDAISATAIEREVKSCSQFLRTIREMEQGQGGPIEVVAVATSAMRDASNSGEVLAALRAIGLEVQVIDGGREAELSFLGTVSGFSGLETPVLCLDVGGGSTELVLGECQTGRPAPSLALSPVLPAVPSSGQYPGQPAPGMSRRTTILKAQSFNIGSRRVTDRFLASDPPTALELSAAADWVKSEMAAFFASLWPLPRTAVAVAGTATTALTVRDGISDYHPAKVHGKTISVTELQNMLDKLANIGLEQRRHCVGLDPQRAEVIVGGLLVLVAALRLAGLDGFTVSETDILQGMLLDFAESTAKTSH